MSGIDFLTLGVMAVLFMTFVIAHYLWKIMGMLEELGRNGCKLDEFLDAGDVDFTPIRARK